MKEHNFLNVASNLINEDEDVDVIERFSPNVGKILVKAIKQKLLPKFEIKLIKDSSNRIVWKVFVPFKEYEQNNSFVLDLNINSEGVLVLKINGIAVDLMQTDKINPKNIFSIMIRAMRISMASTLKKRNAAV